MHACATPLVTGPVGQIRQVRSGHDEDGEAPPREQLARNTTEMESRMGRTPHDNEVGPAILRQELELGCNLTVAAGEVAANTCLAQLLGHKAREAIVAVGVTGERDRREEPAEGGCPGDVGDEAGVDTALFAHRQADGHRERPVARFRAVGPDDDASYAHALLSRSGRVGAGVGRSDQLTS